MSTADQPTPRRRVVIVGGGIAGLAAAWFLRAAPDAPDVLVLEGARRVGGKLQLSDVAGLPVDEGAESLLARRPEGVEFIRAVGLGDELVEPATTAAGVWSRGQLRPLPTRTVMGVPGDLSTLGASRVLSVRGLARVPLDRTRKPSAFGRGELADIAVGEYVADRLGTEVTDRLVEPLLGGVYAGRSRELSFVATVPALAEAARQHASLLGAAESLLPVRADAHPSADAPTPTPAVFASLRGGLGRLPRHVVAALTARSAHVPDAQVEVRTDATVREISRTPTGWRLVVGAVPHAETIDADAVVLAVPAAPLARLLQPIAAHVGADAAAIEYASVGLVTLVYPVDEIQSPPEGSGFLVPPIERRVTKAATVMTNKWGWLQAAAGPSIVVRCSVGRHRESGVLQRADAELVRLVEREVAGFLGIQAQPVASRVSRWGGALPQYAVGHVERVARIRAGVAQLPGLAVCGAAFDGVGVPACIASARTAAEQVLAHLGERAGREGQWPT